MEETKKNIEAFFSAYAARFNNALNGEDPDVNATADSFAEYFIEANPSGVQMGKNDRYFRAAIPKGYSFYRSTGMVAMNIAEMTITPLDQCHHMVKIHWHSLYKKKEGERAEIEFDVHYFLQQRNGQFTIFAYITGDEQAALKEKGLLPEEAEAVHG